MRRPAKLDSDAPLLWAPGTGNQAWEMFTACIAGDLATVQRLVGTEPGLVRTQFAYRTPIYFAVRENQIAVAEYLLDQGADPIGLVVNDSLLDICRDRGYGELLSILESSLKLRQGASERGEEIAAAIREGDLSLIRARLDADPELLSAGDARSNQPIHWAVMTRRLDIVDELLSRGADPQARRADGARPIHLTNGDYHFRGWRDVPLADRPTPSEVLTHLRARGVPLDMGMACYVGEIDRVRELLRLDPGAANRVADYVSYYVGSGAPLKNAASAGHLEIVKLLLEHGADPNLPEEGIAPHGHALYAAVVAGHHAIARLLLEHGAFPNPEVESSADALSRAISKNDHPMVELLCQYSASRPVHLLAYSGDVKTAAAVFAANPALADDPEALANAAGEGHEAFVRLMLRYVPDLPRRLEFPGWSVGSKTRSLDELLFAHGMDPSQPDWLLTTPLHHLARKGDVVKAEYFLENGADLAARDEDICSTPLGWAAKFGQTEMVKFLLSHGAPAIHAADPPWATPLQWAVRRGHEEIAAILRASG